MSQARLRIAADVGGTFTDIACLSPDGELATCKIPSTPQDYARAIIEGIGTLTRGRESEAAEATVLHASTVATNAILEGKGANTALRDDPRIPRRAGATAHSGAATLRSAL